MYEIVRFYQDDRPARIIQKNLSKEKAVEWCLDPETSSMTAKKPRGCESDQAQIDRWHAENKHWFDAWRSM